MYRSWAYILMAVATLAGVVALIWPGPSVRTIEEISLPVRPAPRAEAPARPNKAAKPAKSSSRNTPKPAPPAVVERMPRQNTATRRAAPVLQNGLQPTMNLGNPDAMGAGKGTPAPPGAPVAIRPLHPARPPAANPSTDAREAK